MQPLHSLIFRLGFHASSSKFLKFRKIFRNHCRTRLASTPSRPNSISLLIHRQSSPASTRNRIWPCVWTSSSSLDFSQTPRKASKKSRSQNAQNANIRRRTGRTSGPKSPPTQFAPTLRTPTALQPRWSVYTDHSHLDGQRFSRVKRFRFIRTTRRSTAGGRQEGQRSRSSSHRIMVDEGQLGLRPPGRGDPLCRTKLWMSFGM